VTHARGYLGSRSSLGECWRCELNHLTLWLSLQLAELPQSELSRVAVTVDWFVPEERLKSRDLRNDEYLAVNFQFPREAGPVVRSVCPAESHLEGISTVPPGEDLTSMRVFRKRAHTMPRRQSRRVGWISWSARPVPGVWVCSAETLSGAVYPVEVAVRVLE
jgi:hypothetical protein